MLSFEAGLDGNTDDAELYGYSMNARNIDDAECTDDQQKHHNDVEVCISK